MKPRVGFVGLGKLGLPVALAINAHGFDVCGTDLNKEVEGYLLNRSIPYREEMSFDLLSKHSITWYDHVADVVRASDVIFVPVQTPHDPRYEGTTPLPKNRVDFNYFYLIEAITEITREIEVSSDPATKTIVIISTVLPGTIRKYIYPIIQDEPRIFLIYNPFFIAMGSVIPDFLDPEFVLLGMDDKSLIPGFLLQIYNEIYIRRSRNLTMKGMNEFYQVMSIESAELTKVAYNTYITSKLCIINTLMEICHKIPGADIDEVAGALKLASRRIVSPMYMDGGMGDGGGCHPRDNIAMSWLARELGLSYDWFENLMISREKQAEFFVDLILKEYEPGDQVYLLGYEFKPTTNLTTGSHALLVYDLLKRDLHSEVVTLLQTSGPKDDCFPKPKDGKNIVFIGVKSPSFQTIIFRSETVVIDPFRYIEDQPGVKVIRIGEANVQA